MRSFAIAVFLATALPAQNLLRWDAWSAATAYTLPVTLSPTLVTYPIHAKGWTPSALIGIEQTFTVARGGNFWFYLTGSFDSSGSHYARLDVGPHTVWNSFWPGKDEDIDGWFGMGDMVTLTPGTYTVRFLTNADNMSGPYARLDPPFLVPWNSLAPIIRAARVWADTNAQMVVESRAANILAMSFGSPAAPLRIPGIGGQLELDPASLLIVGTAANGGVKVDFNRWMDRIAYTRRVAFQLQAATWTRFGPRASL